jgi:hypothetical protein
MDPNFGLGHWTLYWEYNREGRSDEAIEELRKAALAEAPSPAVHGVLYVRTGRLVEAHQELDRLEREMTKRYGLDFDVAGLALGVGDRDLAFRVLERGFRDRNGGFIIIAVDPQFESLHDDPRFADLVRRVGVASVPVRHDASHRSLG